MKREVPVKRLLLASMAVLLVAPAPSSAQMSKAAARAALLQTDVEWAASAAGTDVERIVSYWTDDAVIYPPREAPISGKTAIRRYVAESLKIPGFAIRWKPTAAVVSASGDLGYTTGTNSFTFPDAHGRPMTTNGRYVTVWRKGPDARWRCVVDSWNEAPSLAGAAAQK